MTPEHLVDLADEAHRTALRSPDPHVRAYAYGVADLAALLAEEAPPSSVLVSIMSNAGPELRWMVSIGTWPLATIIRKPGEEREAPNPRPSPGGLPGNPANHSSG